MDTPHETISVVIPSYNVEKYLQRAVDSVLRQTLQPQEVIVVDDGATDGTADIAKRYGPPVKYIYQENRGLAATRNTGIRNSRGYWIALLDADDEWVPNHLANAMGVLQGHPPLEWYAAAYEARREGTGVIEGVRRCTLPLVDGRYLEDFFLADARSPFTGSVTMVISRRAFEEVGLFDESLRAAEDWQMWFRLGLKYPRIGYSREVGAIYWLRGDSLTSQHTNPPEKILSLIESYERMAAEMGPAKLRQVEPLIMRWIGNQVRAATREGNREILRRIELRYGCRLPMQWRVVSRARRMTPGFLWNGALACWRGLRRLLQRLRMRRGRAVSRARDARP
ncbi:MAG TPA: glycosyltransferase [Phycisphaerae bacterium]|nr:glycosyltransferase [Phycisphaerae bacterium]